MNSARRLGENIAALSVLQVANSVVPLITVPYLARVLHLAQFGQLAFAQALVLYFDIFVDYGFNLSASRAVACCRDSQDALSIQFWKTIAARIVLALVSAAVLTILVLCVPQLRAAPMLYAGAFLTVLGTALFPVWFFLGIEEMRYITIAHSSARLLTIPALLLWVHGPNDVAVAAAIQGSVPVWAALIVVPVLWKKLAHRFLWPSPDQIVALLRSGWQLFLSSAASATNAATTPVLLQLVAGNAEVGYFTAADKVIRAVAALANSATLSLYPHLTALKSRSDRSALLLIRRSSIWLTALSSAASLAIFFLAPLAGPMLWGPRFVPAVGVLRCLAPLPILLALINNFGTQTLLVFGLDSLISRISLFCTLLNAVLTMLLGRVFGATGAALAIVATACVMLAGLSLELRRTRVALPAVEARTAAAMNVRCE